MIWAPFLHWYQPPNQREEIILSVIQQSYDPVVSLLERFARARITLNINGCLTEQIARLNPELLERIKKLVTAGQIELTAAAKYHALLPLISPQEIERQINLNLQTNAYYLGESNQPTGFFPSELAYNDVIARVLSKMGFKWILLDEISLNGNLENEGFETLYSHQTYPNLKLFFSDRQISHRIRAALHLNPEKFWTETQNRLKHNQYLITANDGEVFGHHYQCREEVLEYAFENPSIETVTFTHLITKYAKKTQTVLPQPGSWETSPEDIQKQNYYPLWYDSNNRIQVLQWELAGLAMKLMERIKEPEDDKGLVYTSSRSHLDRGLHSCHFWWASAYPWWNPDMIVEGATELIRSIRGFPQVSKNIKRKAEKIYAKIIEITWQWHWSGEAQKKIDEFDEKKTMVWS